VFFGVSWLNTQMVNGVAKQKENIVQPEEPETEVPKASRIFCLKLIWEWVNLGTAGRDGKPGMSGVDSGHCRTQSCQVELRPLMAKKTRKLIKN